MFTAFAAFFQGGFTNIIVSQTARLTWMKQEDTVWSSTKPEFNMTLLLSLIKLIDILFWLDKAKNDTYLVFFLALGMLWGLLIMVFCI